MDQRNNGTHSGCSKCGKFMFALFLVVVLVSVVLFPIYVYDKKSKARIATCNVQTLGARPDGKTDSTNAFLNAWSLACASTKPVVIYVPQGTYMVGSLRFEGKCNNNDITFLVDGTLVAPSDYRDHSWIQFNGVDGITIYGGTLNGQGPALWACKAFDQICPDGAKSLIFSNSTNIGIDGLMSSSSQQFHIVISDCQNVKLQGVKAFAPENSPNTDGIHLQQSSNVIILNSEISTGDDCISIGPGVTNVWIEQVTCGPGHGISIGSLGWGLQEAGVQNVTVKTVTFKETQNGFRIKTWARSSNGFVRNILFQNAIMVNVNNPIVIDQHYCPQQNDCPTEESGVEISDITYSDIHGTSGTQVAVKFDCSKKNMCTRVTLEDINLTYNNVEAAALATCVNAEGTSMGQVEPPSCLMNEI